MIQPYTYTSREYDPETNLYYYRARYYDARVGRFIGEDLIFRVNMYTYVNNNAINRLDPLGLWEITYSGGAHFPTGPWPIAGGGSESSALKNPLNPSGGLQGEGFTPEATAGVFADVGVNAGVSDLSNTGGKQAGVTIGIGSGRYGGIQITLRCEFDPNSSWFNPKKYIDGISVGLGLGVGLPVTVTVPLK